MSKNSNLILCQGLGQCRCSGCSFTHSFLGISLYTLAPHPQIFQYRFFKGKFPSTILSSYCSPCLWYQKFNSLKIQNFKVQSLNLNLPDVRSFDVTSFFISSKNSKVGLQTNICFKMFVYSGFKTPESTEQGPE